MHVLDENPTKLKNVGFEKNKRLFLFKCFSTTTAMMIYTIICIANSPPFKQKQFILCTRYVMYVGFKKSKCYYAEIHFNIQTFKWFEIFQWCLKHFLNLVKHSNAYYIIHVVCYVCMYFAILVSFLCNCSVRCSVTSYLHSNQSFEKIGMQVLYFCNTACI